MEQPKYKFGDKFTKTVDIEVMGNSAKVVVAGT